jgi:serine/threonine protein kinase
MTSEPVSKITSFDFQPGKRLARKYEVVSRLGAGWEGEVYLIRELNTGIERAAKFFFPKRNPGNRALRFYAKKLHKLRDCSILIQYYTQETIQFRGVSIPFLVSEYVEGELLSEFLNRQPGKRILPFQAVHLLHALVSGMGCVHKKREYHGDLHTDNIIVRRYGLGFDLKLLDMYHLGAPRPENLQDDLVDVIKVFHEALGGAKHYGKQPPEVKEICLGLKRSFILKKFKTTEKLREYLETMRWK